MGGDHRMSILAGFWQDLTGNDELQKTIIFNEINIARVINNHSTDFAVTLTLGVNGTLVTSTYQCLFRHNHDYLHHYSCNHYHHHHHHL